MTIPDSLQTLGEHVFHECFKPVLSNIDVQEYDSDDEEITDATSEVVAHLRFQQLLSGNNFLKTDDFRRLLVPFLQSGTLMSIRLASKPWSRLADAFISDGVESGAMIVRGEENLRGSHDDLKERHQLATSAIFPLSIKKVGDLACCDAINLVVVDIPEGVESIGRMAFGYCSSLTTVSFPRTLTPIGDLAFNGCSSLVNVDFRHTSLKELGDFAFAKCSELKSMTIPDSLQTLGRDAFRGCTKLVPSNFNWDTYDNDAVVAHLRSLQKN